MKEGMKRLIIKNFGPMTVVPAEWLRKTTK